MGAVTHHVDAAYVFAEISRLLINYPDLMKAFGMFLPPSINLPFQSGVFLHLRKTESTDKQATAVKCEPKEMPSTSSNEQMMEVSPSNEIDSNLSQDDPFEQREPNSLKEVYEKRAKSFLDRVEDRFKEEPHIYRRYIELLTSLQNDSSCDQIDIGSGVLQEILDLFHGHDDLIDEFKSFIPNAACESPEDVCNVFIFFLMRFSL
ncbi:uncharacterized protein TNIN_225742 [Trichonephila inaurata madagascariensis]|uniref:Uncharacterized protein n=1 Tax=Trichonephila inaurata madagascariensis TaxID=2747483 RepID=A0A8X7BYU6_9ARAC|nr:uncharacterized protein TNIN_225742 [Trichonephila inaurata madagascariensis]